MKCTNCGKVVSASVKVCGYCGHRLKEAMPASSRRARRECPECGFTNRENVSFCEECGAGLAAAIPAGVVCPTCQHQNPGGAAFCEQCGTSLSAFVPLAPAKRTRWGPIVFGGVIGLAVLALAIFILGPRQPVVYQQLPAPQNPIQPAALAPTATPYVTKYIPPAPQAEAAVADTLPDDVIYFEDFEDQQEASLHWPVGPSDVDYTYVEGGMLHVVQTKELKALYYYPSDPDPLGDLQDFVLTVDVKYIEGPVPEFGVRFRRLDSQNFYRFAITNEGWFWLGGHQEGPGWFDLVDWSQSSYIRTGSQINHLTVAAEGTTLDAYVNDHRVAVVVDERFSSGWIALFMQNDKGSGSHVAFDNFTVRRVTTSGAAAAQPPANQPAQPPASTVPMASVTQNSNCRTGPSVEYEHKSDFLIGDKAEVVGKGSDGDYWIVKSPHASGTCWLWDQYAVITGDTSKLPVMTPPPLPKPVLSASVAPSAKGNCHIFVSGENFSPNRSIIVVAYVEANGGWQQLMNTISGIGSSGTFEEQLTPDEGLWLYQPFRDGEWPKGTRFKFEVLTEGDGGGKLLAETTVKSQCPAP